MKTTPNQDFKTKIFFALSVLLITLISFDLGRIYLLIKYSNIFTLTSIQILKTFLFSIKFDLSIMTMFYCVPFVMLFLPIKSIKYYKLVISVIWVMFFIMLIIMIGDLIYFQESKAHITEELFLALSDFRFIIKYSLTKYWVALISLILFVYLFHRLSVKAFKNFYNPKKVLIVKNLVISLFVFGIIFLMIKGNISGMTLGIVDVYKITNNIQEVNLILNGVFTGAHAFVKDETTLKNNTDINNSYEIIKKYLLSENEQFINDNYPLMRNVKKQYLTQNYNVCIVLLEGWSFKHIDSLSNTNYGVTPYFDKIVSESIVFNNAYAVGTRSMFGLYAIFAGLPLVPGFIAENSSYTYGLELKNMFSIVDIFNGKGYYTAYMQTSPVDSNKFFGVMAKTNFRMKETFSEDSIPVYMKYKEKAFYGYDYDLCMFMDEKISKLKKDTSFFILGFTGSTHIPFTQTTDEFEKYPRTTEENKYLNSLYYADYSIGALIEKAKQKGWFDNTIFIFVADHVPNGIEQGNSVKDKFHIPFVIYAPKIFKPQEINYTVSQLDIIPTLAHLFSENLNFTALGTNALDENANHCAFLCEGNNIAIIEDDNFMRHNRQSVLETNVEKDSDAYKKLEEKLLSFDKVVSDSFKYNKWFE
ncbi:MAG: sulfatase-like hydrolase/transferase [Elusimicrobia bacterium]|nr:sulfatase-like hydrolase/transferase [Elusimicrobiota bacterium]